MTNPRQQRKVNCPGPDCHGRVGVLPDPRGFDDLDVPLKCQRCGATFDRFLRVSA